MKFAAFGLGVLTLVLGCAGLARAATINLPTSIDSSTSFSAEWYDGGGPYFSSSWNDDFGYNLDYYLVVKTTGFTASDIGFNIQYGGLFWYAEPGSDFPNYNDATDSKGCDFSCFQTVQPGLYVAHVGKPNGYVQGDCPIDPPTLVDCSVLLTPSFVTLEGSASYIPPGATVEAYLTEDAPVAPPRAVPEPGAWALLLAGFGMLGVLLRRRRESLLAAAAAR